ncbi:MAG: ABC transporter permease, partial [Firmicutes bacterium]|nr:ABC transporter permease [Bacillota bacterium]
MKKYLFRRIIQLPIILLGVVIVTFLIIQLAPGDPAVTIAGSSARPEDIEAIREQLGLNQPLWKQFLDYLVNLL